MPDPDPKTPDPKPDPTPTPAPDSTPNPDKKDPNSDPVALAKQLGEKEAEIKALKEYKEKADPIMETLASDKELLDRAIESHNKRTGVIPKKPADTMDPSKKDTTPVADTDTRNAVINNINENFEKKVGIDQLPDDKKKEIRGLVGQMIKTMVDPKDNKTISQIFDEISLSKLPWYLERAHELVSRNTDIKSAEERGRKMANGDYEIPPGAIGSIPSGSVPIDQVMLTAKQKAAAKKMGLSEEDYLKSYKEILAARSTED